MSEDSRGSHLDSPKLTLDLGEYVRNSSSHPFLPSSKLDQWKRGFGAFHSKLSELKKPSGWWYGPADGTPGFEEVQEAAAKDPCLPSLTRQQRMTGFLACFCGGLICMAVGACYIPVLILRGRKFAILFTCGSLLIFLSIFILRGPEQHLRSMLQADRLPFTTLHLLSVCATLYVALVMQSTVLTVVCAVLQIWALLWYTLSYVPGGHRGIMFFSRFATKLFKKTAASTLDV